MHLPAVAPGLDLPGEVNHRVGAREVSGGHVAQVAAQLGERLWRPDEVALVEEADVETDDVVTARH